MHISTLLCSVCVPYDNYTIPTDTFTPPSLGRTMKVFRNNASNLKKFPELDKYTVTISNDINEFENIKD